MILTCIVVRESKGQIMLLLSFILISLSLALLFVFYKLWWTPIRLQYMMNLQGIKGPSYKFFYGNTKEILRLQMEARNKPMGLSHDIVPKLFPHVYSWINLYGKNVLQWFGFQAEIVITEIELIREIMNDKDGVFVKVDPQGFIKKLLGGGLGMIDGEKWLKRRKLANHAFHGANLKDMVPAMISSVESMIERWEIYEGKEIDIYQEFRLLTSEIISKTAFGSSYLEGENIFEMLMKLTFLSFKNGHKPMLPGISKFVKTEDDIESEKLEKVIRQSIIKIVKQRQIKVKNGEDENFGSDYLGLLLQAYHDDNENEWISMHDIVDECKLIYFAGQETTNSLLSWTMLLLAIHTDWQQEARNEVFDLFGQRNPNAEDIVKLKKMGMIINEALRLYPPVSSTSRKVQKQVQLGKFILPANMHLQIPIVAIHHDPKIWGEDVHLFKPERFSQGIAKATKNNLASFCPFGIGPRICAGLNFALIETKVALTMILQRYSFTLSPAYVHSPIQVLTNCPQHGVQVMLNSL